MSGEATVHLLPDTWVKSGTWPDPSTPTILGPPDLEEKVPDPKDVVLHAKLFSGGQRSGVVSADVMDTHTNTHTYSLFLARSLALSHTHDYIDWLSSTFENVFSLWPSQSIMSTLQTESKIDFLFVWACFLFFLHLHFERYHSKIEARTAYQIESNKNFNFG